MVAVLDSLTDNKVVMVEEMVVEVEEVVVVELGSTLRLAAASSRAPPFLVAICRARSWNSEEKRS